MHRACAVKGKCERLGLRLTCGEQTVVADLSGMATCSAASLGQAATVRRVFLPISRGSHMREQYEVEFVGWKGWLPIRYAQVKVRS